MRSNSATSRLHGVVLLIAFAAGCGSGDSPAGPAPSVTAVTARVESGQNSVQGPFQFTGTVTATGVTAVTYRWELSNGELQAVQQLSFGGAGSLATTYSYKPGSVCLGNDVQMWARLNVLTPNVVESAKVPFTQKCVDIVVPRIPI